MTAENLLIGLVVLIYIVSFVFKTVLKKKPADPNSEESQPAPKQSGWRAKLDQLVDRMQQGVETAKQEGDSEQIGWEELRAAERAAETRHEPQAASVDSSELASATVDSAAGFEKPETIQPGVAAGDDEQVRGATAAARASERIPPGLRPSGHIPQDSGRPAPPRADINRSALRQAVIWSEILAPPLALRDQ